jgi:valyl-tRNA synthetase
VTKNLDGYELGLARRKSTFYLVGICDWYIEIAKSRLYGDSAREK